jgi:hypothetical protein
MTRTPSAAAILLAFAVSGHAYARVSDPLDGSRVSVGMGMRLDLAALRGPGPVRVGGIQVAGVGEAALVLERFTVTGPGTRFVVGDRVLGDRPLEFDPASVELYRGHVEGREGSSAFIAVTSRGLSGRVDLGGELGVLRLASPGRDGEFAEVMVEPASVRPGAWPDVPMCGVASPGAPIRIGNGETPQQDGPIRGLQQIQLAVETDFELFEQLGLDLDVTAEYIVVMYGAISDIYIRDVNARVDLSFVRLWDTPDDLFNEPEPLDPFRDYWNEFMGDVARDVAQFCTGRRDLTAGGVAWVNGLCNDRSYSWAGYMVGYEETLGGLAPSDYDVSVAAHEIGHNCGVFHNHDYGIDECDDPSTEPKRGGIMSYCGQTFSGGKGNTDMRFETLLQDIMVEYITSRNCIADDCNGNGVRDSQDINNGTSQDANGNGSPDECEDCNGNGVLDSQDIASGTSEDIDGNGVPDECEPDCNGNGIPDRVDIAEGSSADLHMDGIPDECQADCDGDGLMDYNQIQDDMGLDIDRNAILDACQDCDGDGVNDMAALGSSRNVWMASLAETRLREFYASSGVLTRVSESEVAGGQDVVITAGGRIFVSSFDDHRIAEFDRTGAFMGDLVGTGGGGLAGPTAMALTAGGTLLVSSAMTNSVLEFSLSDGSLVRQAVAPGTGGLVEPFGLAISPAGRLIVTSADNRVLEFDLSTGQHLRDLVSAGEGGLSTPRCIAYKPDGNLLVVSYDNRSALEYHGQTGDFIGKWNRGGTENRLVLDEPWGIRIGPDGDVYISTSHVHRDGEPLHLTKARLFHFDIRNGNFLRAYVEGDDTGLYGPTGFDFFPASPDDCNANQMPDACDIASGVAQDCNGNGRPDTCDLAGGSSLDVNGNGVPDECECYADCDQSTGVGVLDLFDFLCFVNAYNAEAPYADCDGSGGLDLFDFLCFTNDFNGGCG